MKQKISKKNNDDYKEVLNRGILDLILNALRISFSSPRYLIFLAKTFKSQLKAVKLRNYYQNQGINVPAFLIASITNHCALNCSGCYNKELHGEPQGKEMSDPELRDMLTESRDLGARIVLLAGGEPLSRGNILSITRDFPDILFPLFSNGLLFDDIIINEVKKQMNIVPVISLEGYENETDSRRGDGVYKKMIKLFEKLKQNNIFYGITITLTKDNFNTVTTPDFINKMIAYGPKVFVFVEYVPVKKGSENLVLDTERRESMLMKTAQFRRDFNALFIAFPVEEKNFGGCLSAGRGFVHISPQGSLEPCPFAPYSDVNLHNLTLKEALGSRLLEKIRENKEELTETGGCALWTKKDWVKSLL